MRRDTTWSQNIQILGPRIRSFQERREDQTRYIDERGRRPSEDPELVAASGYIWNVSPRSEEAWWPDLDRLTNRAISMQPLHREGLIGGVLIRNFLTGHLNGGCFVRFKDQETRNRAFDMIHNIMYNGRPILVREADSACIMANMQDQDRRAARGGTFAIGEVRWAQHLLYVPQIYRDIDNGTYQYGLDDNICAFCATEGHQRTTCPTLRELVSGGSDYVCFKCNSVNHHLTNICPFPDDYGYANTLR